MPAAAMTAVIIPFPSRPAAADAPADPPVIVPLWTGHHARLLRLALRLSGESFADRLGVAVRTVAYWTARPGTRPHPEIQRRLDEALAAAPGAVRRSFAALLADMPGGVA